MKGNRAVLLRNGAEAFPAMLDAIDHAEHQILLEMYWFGSDRIGQQFADALLRARGRGVEVSVIYDALGSMDADPSMFDSLRAAGIAVIEFHPLLPWRRRFKLEKLSRRDHRKILVVDQRLGFTGGINFADHWLPEDQGGDGWRDDMVLVEGPAVRGLAAAFRHTWLQEGGRPLAALTELGLGLGSDGSDSAVQNVRVLAETSLRHRRRIMSAYLHHIYGAKRRVWITNSYFMPDRSFIRALKRAADRGVDVRLLLPGFSDVEVVRHAGRALWGGLLRHGVKIYEWQRSILHAKTAVIDGVWSTIGTFNLDYRSLLWNLEINVAILDEAFAAGMERAFEADLAESCQVDPQVFFMRSIGERLLEYGLFRFHKLL